jgi:hypothetical protein
MRAARSRQIERQPQPVVMVHEAQQPPGLAALALGSPSAPAVVGDRGEGVGK